MKILIVSPAHPLRGGIASSSERLGLALQQAGHEVELISFKLQYPDFLFPGKTQFTKDKAPEDLTIHTLINSVNPINWIKTGFRLKKMNADLIIVRYWMPFMGPSLGTILKLAKANGKTKIIALADNIIPHEKRPGDYWLTKYFCSSVDAFLVMSKSVGEDVRKFTKEKPIVFSPHPIYDNYGALVSRDEALQQLDLDPSFRYLLFFGFIRDYKGLDLLLEAMADEKVRAKPVRLIVAGEYYGNREKYDKLIDELQIRGQLVLHNSFIPHEEVKYFFGASDMVVQPYKTATQSGITQLAYHFEVPMLVTNVGGLPEIVADGEMGYVVKPDKKEVAAGIHDFFAQNRYDQFLEGVRQNKERFSWTKMVEKVEALFLQLKN